MSQFDGVARAIAKGAPPEWLALALEHFSDGIAKDKSGIDLDRRIERMGKAIDVLMRDLPLFAHLPYGMKCPADVAVALAALPQIKKYLDLAAPKSVGRPPAAQREVCAAVVLEALEDHSWRGRTA